MNLNVKLENLIIKNILRALSNIYFKELDYGKTERAVHRLKGRLGWDARKVAPEGAR